MPLYFFNIADGTHTYTDDEGVDLEGLDAACRHAMQDIREIAQHFDNPSPDWDEWAIEVLDEQGHTVLRLPFLEVVGRSG